MYLNTSKKIKNTVGTRDNRHLNMVVSKFRVLDTPDTHLGGGTPEYKLNSGSPHTKHHTFSCMGGVL